MTHLVLPFHRMEEELDIPREAQIYRNEELP